MGRQKHAGHLQAERNGKAKKRYREKSAQLQCFLRNRAVVSRTEKYLLRGGSYR